WKEFVPAGASPAVDKALKIKGRLGLKRLKRGELQGASPKVEKALKIKAHKDQQRNRGFDIAQCVADVTNSASYIVRVILQIRTAA
ncbi:unnamed protein product, partial [Symbiodinium microadriaticum]